MRMAIFLFGVVLSVNAQTVFTVPAKTKNNRLELRVQQSVSVENVTINATIVQAPAWMRFDAGRKSVRMLPAQTSADVSFTFDVSSDAVPGDQRTFAVLLTNESGESIERTYTVKVTSPFTFALRQNFPNPFNPATTIEYELPSPEFVTVTVFDLLGRQIVSMVNQQQEPGRHTVSFDGTDLSSGVYYYRVTAGSFSAMKKMLLLR